MSYYSVQEDSSVVPIHLQSLFWWYQKTMHKNASSIYFHSQILLYIHQAFKIQINVSRDNLPARI